MLDAAFLARTGQHTGMAGRIRKGAVCCWREGYGSDGFKVTCLFYSSFPASFSSSLLELVWRVSFYPFCLGLYLPWPKAITLNPQVNPNRDQLTRELLPPNNNPAAFRWWSGSFLLVASVGRPKNFRCFRTKMFQPILRDRT